MTRCRKGGNNAVNKFIACTTSGLVFHKGCIVRFISSRLCKPCCKLTYQDFINAADVNRLGPPSNSERDARFDNGRNLANESLLNFSDISPSQLIANSSGLSPPSIASVAVTPLNPRIPPSAGMALPPNWSAMTVDDKLAEVFCKVSAGIQKTEDLSTRIDTLTQKVDDQ